ncbi:hypothetical protein LTR10_005123 [Elasticomyces elasticus]|nr:hypothetical protein LTR10_005123 [Elasticomyces elasticus]KAK4975863.1 hypothetical protein LTR42_003484 [Elasticomyces elasticus]
MIAANRAATAKAANNQDAGAQDHDIFPLFKLPPEIWIKICRLAATSDPIKLNEKLEPQEFKALVAQPAITQTCWAVRAETLDTFYASSFVYADYAECENEADRLCRWLSQVYVKQKRVLAGLVIESVHDDVLAYHRPFLNEFELDLQKVGQGDAIELENEGVELCDQEGNRWENAETVELYKVISVTEL